MILYDAIKTIDLHLDRAEKAYCEIKEFSCIDALSIFSDFEKIKIVDTFVFRFIKLQDFIGEKLFKEFLIAVGNYRDDMTMLDMLNYLEKLGIIENANTWMDYRSLRNVLTHEYPDNEDDIINGIKTALEVFVEIKKVYQKILSYLKEKKVI